MVRIVCEETMWSVMSENHGAKGHYYCVKAIGMQRCCKGECFKAGFGDTGMKSFLLKIVLDQLCDIRFVFDNEDCLRPL